MGSTDKGQAVTAGRALPPKGIPTRLLVTNIQREIQKCELHIQRHENTMYSDGGWQATECNAPDEGGQTIWHHTIWCHTSRTGGTKG
mmetsp:Transcript_117240/g.204139  ORF Transcript_117240/g.204139 Transcript_117240/m.204139 type:complete len:87 (-) Transcript_117240:2137-2397(-)